MLDSIKQQRNAMIFERGLSGPAIVAVEPPGIDVEYGGRRLSSVAMFFFLRFAQDTIWCFGALASLIKLP